MADVEMAEMSELGVVEGHSFTGARKTQKSGLCKALESNVFDCGHKAAADQMRTSCEKLVQNVGTTYGQDISNELHNKTTLVLPDRAHSGRSHETCCLGANDSQRTSEFATGTRPPSSGHTRK
jgi:hypothetical protein